jgi:hypothetical protein
MAEWEGEWMFYISARVEVSDEFHVLAVLTQVEEPLLPIG